MTSAHELTSDGEAGLDIAATPIACHDKFHRRTLTRSDAYTSSQELAASVPYRGAKLDT